MTNVEYLNKVKELYEARQSELAKAERNVKSKYNTLLAPFTKERIDTINTQGIEIGDIITDTNKIIEVRSIDYHGCDYSYPYGQNDDFIEFRGIDYTKKMQPNKRGGANFIQQRNGVIPEILKKHE